MERYFRQITASVMQFYLEFEDGLLPREQYRGEYFEPRIIDYRIDVGRVLSELGQREEAVIMAIHRDGLTHEDALRQAGIPSTSPHKFVAALEVKLGKTLERKNLLDFLAYIQP